MHRDVHHQEGGTWSGEKGHQERKGRVVGPCGYKRAKRDTGVEPNPST
jgi:hypothetical protein